MSAAPATLAELLPQLSAAPADAPVVFRTPQGEIGAGYHLTELKLAQINSIDCGGNLNDWTETQLQVLDGQIGAHLQVGKITEILQRSAKALPGLMEARLSIETAPGNQGLGRYSIGSVQVSDDRVLVDLSADRATCKPVQSMTMSCCAAGAAQSACCG